MDAIRVHVKEHYDANIVDRSSRITRLLSKKFKNRQQTHQKLEDGIAIKEEDEYDGDTDGATIDLDGPQFLVKKSHWSKRSGQKTPLNIYQRAQVNPDEYLCESQNSQQNLRPFIQLKQELDLQNHLAQQMPNVIENQETSLAWDIALLKTETTKFTFGIPGECICFMCNTTLRTVPEKHTHQISLHGGGTQTESFKCKVCSQYWTSEETAFAHVKSNHFELFTQEDANEQRQPILNSENSVAQFQCKYCSLIATTEIAFWAHTFLRHKRYKQKHCEICNQLSCNAPQYRRHILVQHGEYRYKCFECTKTFSQVESFKIHVKEHEAKVRSVYVTKYTSHCSSTWKNRD